MRAFIPVVALCSLLVGGCSTSSVPVAYQAPTTVADKQGKPQIRVGDFTDTRKVDPRWLGAIRGGFGQPLKVLETEAPVREVVAKAFSDGLAARGMLQAGSGSPYVLTAVIEKFDCSQYVRRQAQTSFTIELRDARDGRIVASEIVQREVIKDSNAFDVGIFASTEDLRVVAVEVLRATVDAALDSPKLRKALSGS